MTDRPAAPTHPPMTGCPFSAVRDRLRRAGLRPTKQRLSLGWMLFGAGHRHVTAEAVYEQALNARVPVSLATVYNTLHQFTQAGLLRQLPVDGAKTVFDTDTSEHHHFVLEEDGSVIDLPGGVVMLGRPPDPPEGMEIAGIDVVVRLRRRAGT